MATFSSGQSQTISSGQSDLGDTILGGGTETVDSGGMSWKPVLDDGLLFDGAIVVRALS
jgi:hypothetical protein